MIRILEGAEAPGRDPLLDGMYRDRKRVFVDLLKWAVPVVDGEYEVDQFDGPRSIYCLATDDRGSHFGSIRLLPTTEPHILGSIFPELCHGPVPAAPDIWELSRGCLSPDLPAGDRRHVRNLLTTAAVEFALLRDISSYTCIADGAWLSQILALGWDCRPLGMQRRVGRSLAGALRIELNTATPDLLRAAGTYVPCRLIDLDATVLAHA